MKTIFFSNTDRGHANHGWLNSYHTFSFGGFHNPSKMNFGALRVLNDDTVNGGMGFSKHPHDNMEIVSIPLEGGLEHQDSMGNKTLIKKGEVQIMSAGTGVFHSEKNESGKAPVKFLQIWVFPDKKNIEPRYDQKVFNLSARKNKFQTVVSPLGTTDEGVKINQNAWFSLVDLENENTLTYNLKDKNNGVYVFVLEGELEIDGQKLIKRDGLRITETELVTITSSQDAEVLLMEIPMSF